MFNTHSYDGKLKIGSLPGISDVKQLSLDDKIKRGLELVIAANKSCIKTKPSKRNSDLNIGSYRKMKPIAILHLNRIVSGMGKNENVDPTNMLVADDLICLCWSYRENSDFMTCLETQLIDMRTGFCPQGRTHRLFQILLAFHESINIPNPHK